LSQKLKAAITVDVDTLESIYKGQGCRRPGGYSHAEMRIGLENLSRFLENYQARATLFMVGNDFRYPENIISIKTMAEQGHEIANHTLTHAQGFRLLSPQEKEAEIAGMEELCLQKIGVQPVGFRSPGWNIGNDASPILLKRGYLYDSSVFPTFVTPVLKMMHWYTMRSRGHADRTTLGHLGFMFAPVTPYKTKLGSLGSRGEDGILEFPITVTPFFRLPFFATFLVSTGTGLFNLSLRSILSLKRPVQFQFHLSDFVDYNDPELAEQVPLDGEGLYVPHALRMPLTEKMEMFEKVMTELAKHYEFIPLKDWGNMLAQTRKNQ
jgi:peptidoglycan-N-acetylglucosamine deacetylase